MSQGAGSAEFVGPRADGGGAWPLPEPVAAVARRLLEAGERALLVGGAVRDGWLGREPADYDLATTALPERVRALFPGSVADDAAFGRVLVGAVDVLTLRREAEYRDRRRPSRVTFTRSVRADLARRDFTVNAMAVDLENGRLLDPWGGRWDLSRGVLRTVGAAWGRLEEDALRVLRAVRLRAQLGLSYHQTLADALSEAGARGTLAPVAAERIRDELERILLGPTPDLALRDLDRYRLLAQVLPECVPMVGCAQRNPMHRHDVWEHSVRAVQAVAPVLHLRWAALWHDVGKPSCRTVDEQGGTHFYGHEVAGADIAAAGLRRLRVPGALARSVVALVRHHMFSYGPETGLGAARRLVVALGPQGVRDLLELRRADRQASLWGAGYGPEGERLLAHLGEIASRGERLLLHQLAVDGHDVMRILGLEPGPAVGRVLLELHGGVLDGELRNRREDLLAELARRGAVTRGDPGGV